MGPTRYNPFGKDLQDLQPEDLAVLRSVSEGWYVDYKQTVLGVERLAKSIASFANQYGGWLFLGIKQSDDGKETAGTFVGIPSAELLNARIACRNAALTKLHPAPYLDLKFLEGPCPGIGLAAGRGVLVLWIPEGMDAPYIHSSGAIFRRVADGSDLKPETDRHILEKLWEKNRRARKRLAERFYERPARSDAESGHTYVHLHLMSDPLRDRGHRSRTTWEEFADIMQNGPAEIGMPFDNVFMGASAYIARQTAGNEPWRLLATWRYEVDCSSMVTIPLNETPANWTTAGVFLRGYKYADAFVRHFREANYEPCCLLDVNLLCTILMGVFLKHRILAARDKIYGPFYFRAHVENMWRRIPFLDIQSYVDFVGCRGIPVIQDRSALAPPGAEYDSMITLPAREADFTSAESAAKDMILAFVVILAALGIPLSVVATSEGEFLDVADRAKEVRRRRSAEGGR